MNWEQNKSAICNICGVKSTFVHQEDEREGIICANCSAASRHRAVTYVLGRCMGTSSIPLAVWPVNKEICILESSGRGPYPMMLKEKYVYYNTEYDPEIAMKRAPSTQYADFQQLAYPEREFDYVLASDVFEHIRDDEAAFREVYRVLKDNGVFIMTVPYNHEWEKTVVRVSTEGEKDIFLLPPEYHGGGGQTLTYRIYGRDLLQRLRGYGFSVGYLDLHVPAYAIGRQFVFLGVKGSYIDLSGFHSQPVTENAPLRVAASPLFLFRLFVMLKYNTFSLRHFASEVVRKIRGRLRKSRTTK